MGSPKKATTRGAAMKNLKAGQDSHATDLKVTDLQATGLQATDLEAPTDLEATSKYKSKPHYPSMEVDWKMYHCSGCKQKFNKTSIVKFSPLKNICRICSHSRWGTDIYGGTNAQCYSQ